MFFLFFISLEVIGSGIRNLGKWSETLWDSLNKFSSGSTTSLSKTVLRFTRLKANFSKALLSRVISLVLYVFI